MNINETAELCHLNARNKGFWDEPKEFGTSIALIHSELSEALECDRKKKTCPLSEVGLKAILNEPDEVFKEQFEAFMKDHLENEFADVLIRVFDVSKQRGINLEPYLKAGMRYNSLRPHKHGKAY